MSISILPDPNHLISDSGTSGSGSEGPGYASVKLVSVQPFLKDRTNSGRLVTRAVASQYWSIDIGYNPMTRDEFDIIFSFLLSKRGGLIPFYISLPQYQAPKDPFMVTNPLVVGNHDQGSSSITYTVAAGAPRKGDLFTINSADSAHTKAYMVTAIDAGQISISPPLVRFVETGATLVFQDPKLRVVLDGDVNEYSLDTNSLYSFGLKLEEALI